MSYPGSLDLYSIRRLSVLMVLALCLHVCMFNRQCSTKQPVVTLSSAKYFDFEMEDPRKDCASCFIAPMTNHSMSQGTNSTMNCAFISNPHPTVTHTRVILASHPGHGSPQQVASVCFVIPTTCSCKLIICGKSDLQPL